MAAPFLAPNGDALIYDKLTGEVIRTRVPTALENVTRNPGRYGHGDKCPADERIKADPSAVTAAEPVLALNRDGLAEDGTLDMPKAPDPMVEMLQAANANLRAENADLASRLAAETERADTAEATLASLNNAIDEAQGGLGAEGEAEPPVSPPAPTPRPKPAAPRRKPAARKASAKK